MDALIAWSPTDAGRDDGDGDGDGSDSLERRDAGGLDPGASEQ